MTDTEVLERACRWLSEADGLLVTGAGMGVDSGLPDFEEITDCGRLIRHLAMRALRSRRLRIRMP